MEKIAIVLCCGEYQGDKEEPRVKIAFKRWFDYVRRTVGAEGILKNSVKGHNICEDEWLYTVTLPFTLSEMSRSGKRRLSKLNRCLTEVISDNDFDQIILPGNIYDIYKFDKCIPNPFDGTYLFICLLGNIIEEVFSKRGRKTWDMDFAVISGDSREPLYTLIDFLTPDLRYITVFSEEGELIEREAGERFLDNGLSVIISKDYKNSIKNSDVVINLCTEKEKLKRIKTKRGAVIINIKPWEKENSSEGGFSGRTELSGIHGKIPEAASGKLEPEVFQHFTGTQIAEILISLQTGTVNDVIEGIFPSEEKMHIISRLFKQQGYIIESFLGSRKSIKTRDINIFQYKPEKGGKGRKAGSNAENYTS